MGKAHRNGDVRKPGCGASTKVQGQSSVTVNDKLWAVNGDPNSHDNGNLIAQTGTLDVKIEGKLVIVIGDTAGGDDAGHSPSDTDPFGHSDDVSAY